MLLLHLLLIPLCHYVLLLMSYYMVLLRLRQMLMLHLLYSPLLFAFDMYSYLHLLLLMAENF